MYNLVRIFDKYFPLLFSSFDTAHVKDGAETDILLPALSMSGLVQGGDGSLGGWQDILAARGFELRMMHVADALSCFRVIQLFSMIFFCYAIGDVLVGLQIIRQRFSFLEFLFSTETRRAQRALRRCVLVKLFVPFVVNLIPSCRSLSAPDGHL